MNARKKIFMAIAILCACVSLFASSARTGLSEQDENQSFESPLGIGLLPPWAQFPWQASSVTGFRLNLFAGHHCDVFALDIGTFVNIADGDMFGLEFAGIYNQVGSSSGSLQIAGLANACSGTFGGLQVSGILNSIGCYVRSQRRTISDCRCRKRTELKRLIVLGVDARKVSKMIAGVVREVLNRPVNVAYATTAHIASPHTLGLVQTNHESGKLV